jgi:hypothetical protein
VLYGGDSRYEYMMLRTSGGRSRKGGSSDGGVLGGDAARITSESDKSCGFRA